MQADPLAYLTAKSHGMTEECQSILEETGLSEDQITLPSMGQPVPTPGVIVPTFKANWPVKAAATQSIFEKALLGQVEGLSLDDDNKAADGDGFEDALDDAIGRDGDVGDEDEEGAGWDMGDDINVDVESDFVDVDSGDAGAANTEADMWVRNSAVPADHVAAGSFESAMQLLNRQVGAVNFEPLKPRFLEIYQASRAFLPATAGLPPLINYVRRNVDETDLRKVRPVIPRDMESITSQDLQVGFTAMRQNNLEDGVKIFKKILHSSLVNAVGSTQEVGEVSDHCTISILLYALQQLIIQYRSRRSSPPQRNILSPCPSNSPVALCPPTTIVN